MKKVLFAVIFVAFGSMAASAQTPAPAPATAKEKMADKKPSDIFSDGLFTGGFDWTGASLDKRPLQEEIDSESESDEDESPKKKRRYSLCSWDSRRQLR